MAARGSPICNDGEHERDSKKGEGSGRRAARGDSGMCPAASGRLGIVLVVSMTAEATTLAKNTCEAVAVLAKVL